MFRKIKLTKNPDIDKYKYSGYGIGFDRKGKFVIGNEFGQNVIFFGADISSFVHANNKTKNILVLGEGITQGLYDTTLTAEKKYLVNVTKSNAKFCLRLHYSKDGTEIIEFKAKNSKILANPLCLGNISEDFSIDND